MTYCEINNYYKQIYGKDFPRATLTKWIKIGKIKAIKEPNGRYNYDFDSFVKAINSEEYKQTIKAKKEQPQRVVLFLHSNTLD